MSISPKRPKQISSAEGGKAGGWVCYDYEKEFYSRGSGKDGSSRPHSIPHRTNNYKLHGPRTHRVLTDFLILLNIIPHLTAGVGFFVPYDLLVIVNRTVTARQPQGNPRVISNLYYPLFHH